MKVINKFLILSILTIAVSVTNANAQKVAVLDVEGVLKNSKVMQNIKDKIAKKQKEFQRGIDKQQSKLEIEGKKLESKKSFLSAEAFEKEKTKFEHKISDLKYNLEEKQNSLKTASVNAMSEVNDKIKLIIKEVSTELKIDLIVPASQTLFYKDEIDISSDVLKKLNKSITKIDVEFD